MKRDSTCANPGRGERTEITNPAQLYFLPHIPSNSERPTIDGGLSRSETARYFCERRRLKTRWAWLARSD